MAMYTSDLLTEWCWTRSASIAKVHATAPISGILFLLPVFCASLNPARFTIAKINKNPTLPAVEMLSNCRVFTGMRVATAVINSPTGWFHN